MYLKTSKITKRAEYNKLSYTSHKIVSKYFVIVYKLKVKEANYEVNFKYGITVSKKVGNAVKRNRCKRIIRLLVNNLDLKDLKNHLSLNIIARKPVISENIKILQLHLNYKIKQIIFCKHSIINVINMFFFVLLLIYQNFISLFMSPSCRYYPSCSNFARIVFKQFGLYGILLILKRIIKCHPFTEGGYDPVPAAKLIKSEEYD